MVREKERKRETIPLAWSHTETWKHAKSIDGSKIASFSWLSFDVLFIISRDLSTFVPDECLPVNRRALISRVIDAWIRSSRLDWSLVSIVNGWGTIDTAEGKARMIYKKAQYLYSICLHFFLYIYIASIWKRNVFVYVIKRSFPSSIYFQYSPKICSLNKHYKINIWNNLKDAKQYNIMKISYTICVCVICNKRFKIQM